MKYSVASNDSQNFAQLVAENSFKPLNFVSDSLRDPGSRENFSFARHEAQKEILGVYRHSDSAIDHNLFTDMNISKEPSGNLQMKNNTPAKNVSLLEKKSQNSSLSKTSSISKSVKRLTLQSSKKKSLQRLIRNDSDGTLKKETPYDSSSAPKLPSKPNLDSSSKKRLSGSKSNSKNLYIPQSFKNIKFANTPINHKELSLSQTEQQNELQYGDPQITTITQPKQITARLSSVQNEPIQSVTNF
jgi:hypothetical protein